MKSFIIFSGISHLDPNADCFRESFSLAWEVNSGFSMMALMMNPTLESTCVFDTSNDLDTAATTALTTWLVMWDTCVPPS